MAVPPQKLAKNGRSERLVPMDPIDDPFRTATHWSVYDLDELELPDDPSDVGLDSDEEDESEPYPF